MGKSKPKRISIDDRWEQGLPHHPESVRLMNEMREVDKANGFPVDLKMGGDGDIGELLLYILDVCFEARDLNGKS